MKYMSLFTNTLLLVAALTGAPSTSSAQTPPNSGEFEVIPTYLAIPPDPMAYPSPVLVGSTVTPVRAESDSVATFTVALRHDATNGVEGEFEIIVHMVDKEVELRVVEVDLCPGMTDVITLSAGPGWTWDEVTHVDILFVSAEVPA